jgi:hypothetical protein
MLQEDEFAKQHNDLLHAIFDANDDLPQRVASLSVATFYDREDDTLTVTFGDVQEALTESVRNQFFLRVDPDSLKLVGIEIPHLSRRLKDSPPLAKMLHRFFPLAVVDANPAADFAGEMRELVCA